VLKYFRITESISQVSHAFQQEAAVFAANVFLLSWFLALSRGLIFS